MTPAFPRFRAVADHAVLAEFDDFANDAAYAQVIGLDGVLAAVGFAGFIEAVPALVSLHVEFDPGVTDPVTVAHTLRGLLAQATDVLPAGQMREVAICYAPELAPDLHQVAAQAGLSVEAVIEAHLAGDYRVFMYGFAPGYAYLTGVPQTLHLPRKPAAVRGVAAGSVIIAGAQCLITTLTMPTGWWILGRSPTAILQDDPARPFLFDVGDSVRFRRIDRAAFDAAQGG